MRKTLLILCLIMGLLEQTALSSTPIITIYGEEVVVTATKIEQYQAQVGSSTTVIASEQMERTGKETVLEVLRQVPGLTVMQSGSLGGLTNIYLRGSKPGHTLVLIDGAEVNDPIVPDRSFDFAHLTTDNIERIEIVRGPQSTLYGSDALGGVINIITRKGKGNPKVSISAEAGAHSTFKESVSVNGSTEAAAYSLSLSRLDSKGISKAVDGAEKDGYKNTTLSSRLSYEIFNSAELNLSCRYTDGEADIDDDGYDDDPNYTASSKNSVLRLEFAQGLKPYWDHKLSLSYNHIHRKDKDENDPVEPADYVKDWYKGDNKKVEWQHNFSTPDESIITAGLEYEEEGGSSYYYSESLFGPYESKFERKSVSNKALYLQNQPKLADWLFVTTGLRVDDHELFGTETTYKVSIATLGRGTLAFKASIGTGFKAPSLYQLYSSYGDPSLKADRSKSYDLGFERSLFSRRGTFGLTYFHNDFENMVDWDSASYKYKNIGRARTEGLEADLLIKPIEDLEVEANYTRTETEDKETGLELLRRPKEEISLNANWHPGQKVNLNLGAIYVGSRKDIKYVGWTAESITMEDYTTVDLSCLYKITDRFQILGRIENLLDEEYQEVYGFAVPGRSFYAGGKANF